jgi:hypothetical protein
MPCAPPLLPASAQAAAIAGHWSSNRALARTVARVAACRLACRRPYACAQSLLLQLPPPTNRHLAQAHHASPLSPTPYLPRPFLPGCNESSRPGSPSMNWLAPTLHTCAPPRARLAPRPPRHCSSLYRTLRCQPPRQRPPHRAPFSQAPWTAAAAGAAVPAAPPVLCLWWFLAWLCVTTAKQTRPRFPAHPPFPLCSCGLALPHIARGMARASRVSTQPATTHVPASARPCSLPLSPQIRPTASGETPLPVHESFGSPLASRAGAKRGGASRTDPLNKHDSRLGAAAGAKRAPARCSAAAF